ncbi:hypothetical protein E2562_035864 [Oryza meyeriana var. granulata]|uniref:Uncharacterized protein n=1 Tax=Oryza meyeriana var. granulata TaxID=110450 RepID=A0A6G1CVV7_9ORYZ|nr:hypothetical protein E2562_035864 [Oryza meyeriana var. granulata]
MPTAFGCNQSHLSHSGGAPLRRDPAHPPCPRLPAAATASHEAFLRLFGDATATSGCYIYRCHVSFDAESAEMGAKPPKFVVFMKLVTARDSGAIWMSGQVMARGSHRKTSSYHCGFRRGN